MTTIPVINVYNTSPTQGFIISCSSPTAFAEWITRVAKEDKHIPNLVVKNENMVVEDGKI